MKTLHCFNFKQGRIHDSISRVRMGRSGDAKTVRKRRKRKSGTDRHTDRRTDRRSDLYARLKMRAAPQPERSGFVILSTYSGLFFSRQAHRRRIGCPFSLSCSPRLERDSSSITTTSPLYSMISSAFNRGAVAPAPVRKPSAL